jgi:hypothetical protein
MPKVRVKRAKVKATEKRQTRKKKPAYDKELPSYAVKDSGTRGQMNYAQYYIPDYDAKNKGVYKVLDNIEKFANNKSLQMSKIPILQNQKIWVSLEFDDGKFLSTRVSESGQDIDFDLWADYERQGKIRKIVGFTFGFSPM